MLPIHKHVNLPLLYYIDLLTTPDPLLQSLVRSHHSLLEAMSHFLLELSRPVTHKENTRLYHAQSIFIDNLRPKLIIQFHQETILIIRL